LFYLRNSAYSSDNYLFQDQHDLRRSLPEHGQRLIDKTRQGGFAISPGFPPWYIVPDRQLYDPPNSKGFGRFASPKN
jgi:hypothetical protein